MNTIKQLMRLSGALGLAALVTLLALSTLRTGAAATFPHGVAAGDTTQTSAVLWAKGTVAGKVLFEYSTQKDFTSPVMSLTATVNDVMQPVKVHLNNLTPTTTYYYRATDAASASASGTFRIAAITGTHAGLRFGVSGDWEAELAPYPSLANADERNLDFFVEHGDTVEANQADTLAEFRAKHNEVYSTYLGLNTWADLRGSTAILAGIDDNEVRNDFAGGSLPATDVRFDNTGSFINETQLYSRAVQAFQEYNPLRDTFYGATGDARTANKRKLYRFNTYGSDAAIFLLDTRSFRDKQVTPLDFSTLDPNDPADAFKVFEFLTKIFATGRTMVGTQQLADLKADLQKAQNEGITWKFILAQGPVQHLGIIKSEDRYEGYAAERTELLKFIKDNKIDNVVFIAAGLHGTIVNNLTYQPSSAFDPLIPVNAFEVIAGPVAIDPPEGPFGPVIVEDVKFFTPTVGVQYDALTTRAERDQFVKQLINDYLLVLPPNNFNSPTRINYDKIGLEGSGIEAKLLQGDYVALHTYGWTEFEINQTTQLLTVTTYGIDYYTETLLINNPSAVTARQPAIISQFIVTPTNLVVQPEEQEVYLPVIIKN